MLQCDPRAALFSAPCLPPPPAPAVAASAQQASQSTSTSRSELRVPCRIHTASSQTVSHIADARHRPPFPPHGRPHLVLTGQLRNTPKLVVTIIDIAITSPARTLVERLGTPRAALSAESRRNPRTAIYYAWRHVQNLLQLPEGFLRQHTSNGTPCRIPHRMAEHIYRPVAHF